MREEGMVRILEKFVSFGNSRMPFMRQCLL